MAKIGKTFDPENVKRFYHTIDYAKLVFASDYDKLLELYRTTKESHRIIEGCRTDLTKTLERQ